MGKLSTSKGKAMLWPAEDANVTSSSSMMSTRLTHPVIFRRSHCGKNAVVIFPLPGPEDLVYEFFWQKNRKDKAYYKCCVCDRQARLLKKQYPHIAQLNADLRRVKVVHVVGTSIVDSDPLQGHHPNCHPLTNAESLTSRAKKAATGASHKKRASDPSSHAPHASQLLVASSPPEDALIDVVV
uniref:Uncharacterized protein n=1 Tax=Plectus sambesii TaxID=2011161 RepID=A0A914UJG2_9BILA